MLDVSVEDYNGTAMEGELIAVVIVFYLSTLSHQFEMITLISMLKDYLSPHIDENRKRKSKI